MSNYVSGTGLDPGRHWAWSDGGYVNERTLFSLEFQSSLPPMISHCQLVSALSRLSSINQRITDMQVRITGVPAVINLGFLHAEATLS